MAAVTRLREGAGTLTGKATMNHKKNDVRAFPWSAAMADSGERMSGMALRDYFAAAAVTGMLAKGMDPPDAAAKAFAVADQMMEHRDRDHS